MEVEGEGWGWGWGWGLRLETSSQSSKQFLSLRQSNLFIQIVNLIEKQHFFQNIYKQNEGTKQTSYTQPKAFLSKR